MTDWHTVVPFIKAAIYERPPREAPAARFMERGPPPCSNYQLPPNVRASVGEGRDRTRWRWRGADSACFLWFQQLIRGEMEVESRTLGSHLLPERFLLKE